LRLGDEGLIDHNALLNYVAREHQPIGGFYNFNKETLTADKTLKVGTDPIYQYLDPSGANRIITLSTEGAVAGDRFIIRHNGVYNSTYYLEVQQAGVVLDRIYAGVVKEFIFDGTNWISRGIGTGENDDKRYQVGIGERANPHARGVAIGYDSSGHTCGVAIGYRSTGYSFSVAIGYNSTGYSYGVAIGHSSYGESYGVAIGYSSYGYSFGVAIGVASYGYSYGVAIGYASRGQYNGVAIGYASRGQYNGVAIGYYARTLNKYYSIAIGYNSRCTRTSETAINIDGNSDYLRQVTQGRWYGRTTNATPTEIFCGGISGERFTIRPKSAVAFKGLIIASTEAVAGVPNLTKAWKVEGLIKRDANGVTTMIAITVTPIGGDPDTTTWDVTVDADDVNEALRITVTGASATTIDWAVRMDCVEVVWP